MKVVFEVDAELLFSAMLCVQGEVDQLRKLQKRNELLAPAYQTLIDRLIAFKAVANEAYQSQK